MRGCFINKEKYLFSWGHVSTCVLDKSVSQTKYLEGVHRDCMCICAFVGASMHLVSIYIVPCFVKKDGVKWAPFTIYSLRPKM